MEKSVRSTACFIAAAVALGACTSSGRPYAHESAPYATAAEKMYSTSGGQVSAVPPAAVVTEPAPYPPAPVVMPAPQPSAAMAPAAPPAVVVTPTTPLTVPQTVAMTAPSDARFAQTWASGNAAEIELARLAYVQAQSPDVRAFARQMLIDHRDMAIKLDNFGLERGYVVVWQLEPDAVSNVGRLRTLEGAAFDRAYMDEMVTSHEKAVALLEAQAASGRETAALADEALPIVRHHLEMARELDARLL